MSISDLIDMTGGGVLPSPQPQPPVMPVAAVVNAAPPVAFTPPPPAPAAPPVVAKRTRRTKAQIEADNAAAAAAKGTPVTLPVVPVPSGTPVLTQPPAAPEPQVPLAQQFPQPQQAAGMSVVDGGQIAYVPTVMTAPPTPVAPPPQPVNTDPLHNQIFGGPPKPPPVTIGSLFQPAPAQPLTHTPIQVLPTSAEDYDPNADVNWDDIEPDDDDEVTPLTATPPTQARLDQMVEIVHAASAELKEAITKTEDEAGWDKVIAQFGNKVQFPTIESQPDFIDNVASTDPDVKASMSLLDRMKAEIENTLFALGIALLSNPDAHDKNNPAHKAIWFARWNPGGIMKLDVNEILRMGVSLSLHQVWVAGEENKWTARAAAMKEQLDELILLKRDGANGSTKQEKEINCVRHDPYMRDLDRQYTQAKYMAAVLLGMSDRFGQLENSLKRPADRLAAEQLRNDTSRGHTRQAA